MQNKKYIIISGANGYLSQFFSKNLFTRITKKNVYYLNKPKDFNFDVLYSELIG